jgi:probable addiction module antidote protein
MPRGRWRESEEQLAEETHAVLIARRKATRSYSKPELASLLSNPEIYTIFLKLCFEYDNSKDLIDVRQGLLWVIRSLNVTHVADKVGLSRVSLYRMLSKGGNPRLQNLVALFSVLGLRLWAVEKSFIRRKESIKRPKDLSTLADPDLLLEPKQTRPKRSGLS